MRSTHWLFRAGFEKLGRESRPEFFLEEIDTIVPWSALVALMLPHYPKGDNGSPPVGLERLLRLYFMQQRFNLFDPGLEDALNTIAGSASFRGDRLRLRTSAG